MNKFRLALRQISIIFILGTGFWGITIPKTQAVQLADGTVAFAKPPRLLNATTTFRSVRARGAKYYFTMFLPETAEESVQKITVNLRQGYDDIEYKLDKTIAAVGTARDKNEDIAIASTTFDPETETVTVIFAEPVAAGTTFTVGLKPKRNPRYGGTYQFGVTAFPAGKKPQGIFLGSARLQFDDANYGDFGI